MSDTVQSPKTVENDLDFVKRMEGYAASAVRRDKDFERLFALARRGAQADTLRAENERLRAILERIANMSEDDADINEWGAAYVARAALTQEKQG